VLRVASVGPPVSCTLPVNIPTLWCVQQSVIRLSTQSYDNVCRNSKLDRAYVRWYLPPSGTLRNVDWRSGTDVSVPAVSSTTEDEETMKSRKTWCLKNTFLRIQRLWKVELILYSVGKKKSGTYVDCFYIPGIRRRAVFFRFRSRSRILDAAKFKVIATLEVLKRHDGW
jgi:hypothetical protein